MPKGVKSYMSLLSDGTKLIRKVKMEDCEELHKDLHSVEMKPVMGDRIQYKHVLPCYGTGEK